MLICHFEKCPYFCDNVCLNEGVVINKAGMCSHIYTIQNNMAVEKKFCFNAVESKYKAECVTIDVEFTEIEKNDEKQEDVDQGKEEKNKPFIEENGDEKMSGGSNN